MQAGSDVSNIIERLSLTLIKTEKTLFDSLS